MILYSLTYFLKNKDRVFEKFKEFKELDENQCVWPMTYLRSNNGGEYVSKGLRDTCNCIVVCGRDLYLTHLGKMVLFKGRIRHWLKSHSVFFSIKVCQLVFSRGFVLLKLPSKYDYDQGYVGYEPSWEMECKETLN